MRIRHILLTLLLVGVKAVAQPTTKLYKFTGPDGKTMYSDRPPADVRAAKTLTFQNGPATPLSAEALAHVEQLKKSADARASASPARETILYSASWCGYCRQAKAFLASRQVPYREYDIDTKDGLAAFARAGGHRGVPLLIVDGRKVTGFSAESYDAVLGQGK